MKTLFIYTFFTLFAVANLKAQTDNCSGATVLTVGASCSSVPYSLPTSFTDNLSFEPSCGTDYLDGFYQFTATSTSTTIQVTDGTANGPNPGVVVLSGPCGGPYTSLGCSQNANGSNEQVVATTVVGQVYYVVIFATNAAGTGVPNNATGGNICAFNTPTNFVMTNGSISACSGTFLDPGSTGDYGNSQTFTYTICPGTVGMSVQAVFSAFSTESCCDDLTIYDGNSTAAPIIGVYQGTNSPGTVVGTSASGCLTFVFESDGSVVSSGWVAAISCVTPPPPSTNIIMTNGSTSACSGTFLDPGATGDYGNSQNFTYTICPSTPGMSVQAAFTAFSTESCCDALTIFDGNSTSSPVIGTYQGTTSPGTVVATNASGCLTFVFTSDGSVVAPGWSATISCVTPPPPPPGLTMTNGSVSSCSDTFYDSGNTGNYANNQTLTYTICSSTPGDKVQAVFSSFNTENGFDFLEIFDGNSTAAPSLGVYTGTTSPGTVQATPSNASGCLTFRFTSNASVVSSGWVAAISCFTPCQTITANFVSSNEAPGPDGIIRLCQGQSVNLVGSGTFSTSGTGATYVWSMGNGATVTGTNINYTYPAVGSYAVNLTVTDPNGCTNTNSINRNIQVSTNPTITTSATPATLCTNQTSALSANVTMTPFTVNCTPPVSGTTFLPDGSGVSYQTAITTNCYNPTQTITQASDFNNVCLTMEHSFLGDLQLELICPNGQTMILKAYSEGGGGTYLGNPIDDLTSGPGTGRTYCFTPTATTLLVNGTTSSAGSPVGNSVVAGNYMPTQPFTNLIGCPLNGSWTIRVTDNLAADDGYIFNWDVNFNASLTAANSFTPTIVSQGWVPATNLTSTSSTTANVVPTTTGNQCFTYSVTDNFGCTYTQPQCINVNCTALPVGLLTFDALAISNERVQLVWETATEQNNDYFLIERSVNGMDNWELVAKTPGAGNSSSPRNYMAFDEAPLEGVSYYRLSQFDFDGTHFVADLQTVLIDRNSETGIEIFPNPSNGLVQVRSDLVSLSMLQITDANGKNVTSMVKMVPQNDASVTIDMRGLSHGVYTIKAGDKTTRLVLE